MNNFSKILGTLVLTIAALTSVSADAANVTATDATVYSMTGFTAASTFSDTILLSGVTSQLPSCNTDGAGHVVVRIARNTDGTNPSADRVFTLALTAFTLKRTLTVQVSDTNTLNGDCQILFLKMF